jgi:uncharacterized membrane protein
MKRVFWSAGLVATFAVLVVAFGYLDAALAEERRWLGCLLIVAGLAIAVPAILRLIEDWPRLKPEHSVDLAFVQIALAVAVLSLACVLGGRPEAFLLPLFKPTPQSLAAPDAGGAAGK